MSAPTQQVLYYWKCYPPLRQIHHADALFHSRGSRPCSPSFDALIAIILVALVPYKMPLQEHDYHSVRRFRGHRRRRLECGTRLSVRLASRSVRLRRA